MTERRSALDRFLEAVPFAVAALVLFSILLWEASARKSPTIFTDELEWTQISRAIAHTGHAARRGQPISFKSLYAFLMAPAWWLPTTASAYTALRYLNTVVMSLTAVPVYLLARQLTSRRAALVAAIATLCSPALFFAALLLPEVLAFPVFALYAYVGIRALAGHGRSWTMAAVVLSVVVVEVRTELAAGVAALALAAVWLWVVGPRGQRLRAGWSRADHAGVVILLVGVFVLLNRLGSPHATEWATVTQEFPGRLWSYAFTSGSAVAIGLGVLPVIAGLAALWLPERRNDPEWRAFASFLAASIITFGAYTGIKAAFLSTFFASRIEERNLIYVEPLLLVGAVVFFTSRRIHWPVVAAAAAFVAWLVLGHGYQLGYPYFESPGYGIAAMANRAFRWDQHQIRLALLVACAVSVAVIAARRRTAVVLVAALAVVVWMTAGEVTSARGSQHQANAFVQNLPKPLDWVDRATGGKGATYLGQHVTDATGAQLMEFWNTSIKHVYSLDATCCGPGPTVTPAVDTPDGTLRGDPGEPYAVAANGVRLVGPVVATRQGYLLTRIDHHPWKLREAVYGRDPGGWIQSDGAYAYFGPERARGTLIVDVGRTAFCAPTAPNAHVTLRVGTVGLDQQHNPIVGHATSTLHFVVKNCHSQVHRFRVVPPVAVQVHVTPLVVPADYGISDTRQLGAQVAFSFAKR